MPPLQSVRILDWLRERIRYLHYSLRTDEAYVYWTRASIRFRDLRHPCDMGIAEIATKGFRFEYFPIVVKEQGTAHG